MVRLICYNVEYCEGFSGCWYQYLKFWRNLFPPKHLDQKIITALKKLHPDLLALVEIDDGSFRAHKNEVLFFKKKLGLRHIIHKIKYPLTSLLYHVPIFRHQTNAMLSKFKLIDIKYHEFTVGIKRMLIEATIHCPQKVTLLLAHLSLGKRTRSQQILELISFVKHIKNPVILMGDFNTLSGPLELKNLLKQTHLKDVYRLHNSFTYPSRHPDQRLDYVLVSPEIKVKKYEVLKYSFSDHRPLLVDFVVK